MRSLSAFARVLSGAAAFASAVSFFFLLLTATASAQAAPPPAAPSAARIAALANFQPHANSSQPAVATPVISLAQGSYSGPQTVTVTESTPGTTLYYSLNGNGNIATYTGPITISRSCTLVVYAELSPTAEAVAWASYYITSVPDSFVYAVAGTGSDGYAGDGGLATEALMNRPLGTATDSAGNLYIADSYNNLVRKVDAATGIISTFAGTGVAGYSSATGLATNTQLNGPISLAFDSSGNLYIGDIGTVRRVDMATGGIFTYAGNPYATSLGDGGPASSAQLPFLESIAIDANNNLYILSGERVREVDWKTQVISTVAGGGNTSPLYSSGPLLATEAELSNAFGIAVDAAANIYIADSGAEAIWKVTRNSGNISVFAGTGFPGYSGDGGPATAARLFAPSGLAVDNSGNVYIADRDNSAIRKVDAATGFISTVAGGNQTFCFSFSLDGGAASSSDLCFPPAISIDNSGNLYFSNGDRVNEITAIGTPPSSATADPVFSLSPGTYSQPQTLTISDATPGASIFLLPDATSQFPYPVNQNTIYPGAGNYHGPIAITGPETIVALAVAPGHIPSNTVSASYNITLPPTTVISAFAGSGVSGFGGQGGPATSADLGDIAGIAFDKSGNLYVADRTNDVIWKVSGGAISVFAGTGTAGDTGDNGPATSATLYAPGGVAVDANGNVFIADTGNGALREVLASNGNIILLANGATIAGSLSMAVDSTGNLYIANYDSVLKFDAITKAISTYAGGGTQTGNGIPATSARLLSPNAIAFDPSDNLYIADESGYIYLVNAKTGLIGPVAGDGDLGTSGDGMLADQAEVEPISIAADGNGNLYLASTYEIRKVDGKSFIISSIAGIGYPGYRGDGGPASAATLCPSTGLVLDSQSNLYFSDICGPEVRKITFNAPAPAPTFDPPAGSYTTAQSVTISDTVPNAAIYYTTDGSQPSTKSAQFSDSVNVTASETINAIAVAPGYGQSPVGSAAYTIRAKPAITWTTPAAIPYGTALSSTQLDATAGVPGTFLYSPAPGTALGIGSHTLKVTFTPTDSTAYAVIIASVTLTVNPATPAIAWSAPSAIAYGTPLSAAQLNAAVTGVTGKPLAGTAIYTPPAGTVLTPGTHTLSVSFTPTDTTDYTTNTATVMLTVNKATPAITWSTPAAIPYGTALTSAQLDASSKVAGSFAYSPASGAILDIGTHTLKATFTPADTADYTLVVPSVTLTVTKAIPAIAWPTPAAITYGTPLSSAQLNATVTGVTGKPLSGTLAYTPSAGTILNAGSQKLSVTFTPTDSTDYAATTATVTLTVNKATPAVTWATPAAISYGAALTSTQLDATSNVAGTFAYSPAAGTVLSIGTHTLKATFTPTDTADYAVVIPSVTLTVIQATPTITWPTPAPIASGTPLSSTQLNATVTGVTGKPLPGTLTYNPPAGTVLSSGQQTLTVSFAPTDTTDYKPATASVTITVQ